MTREQIEAELKTFPFANLHPLTPDMTILFAQHIAKLEREACAKVCDYYAGQSSHSMNFAENCADSIRARGDK